MTILEKMKETNSTILEKEINDKYYLFIEGLTEFDEATDDINKVANVLVEIHEQDKVHNTTDFIDTIGYGAITLDTEYDFLSEKLIKSICNYELD